MLPKKTRKGNLENRRGTFTLIGLVLILGLVYLGFELFATQNTYSNLPVYIDHFDLINETDAPLVDLTTPPPAPTPPEPIQDILINITEGKETADWNKFIYDWTMNIDDVIPDPPKFIEPIVEPVDNLPIFKVSDVMPEYPGGPAAMYAFLGNNIVFPKRMVETGIQGTSLIEFVVEIDGSVSNTKVRTSLHPECDNEAIRVIKMLKFSPGLINGKPVRVLYSIPVQFSLQ